MSRKSFRLASAALWLLAVWGCAAGPQLPGADPGAAGLVRRFSAEQLATILREEGYGSVEILGEDDVRFFADGMVYLLLCYDDGDLQLFWGLRNLSVSQEAINEWNRTKRLSRAYLDQDRSPALESDLLSDAGLTRAQVARFVQVFVQASHLYHAYLVEHGEVTPDSEPLPAAGSEI